mgnify:CR=1 FL=1
MSEFESSSSIDGDETRATQGAELASRNLSSEQNKIRRELMQKKLVRNSKVFNFPITHIHRPLVDVNTGQRPLEIREAHRMHVPNLKRKMKINPHAIVLPLL